MIDKGFLEQEIIKALKQCYDPEIPVDIYELGLIYKIKVDDEGNVYIKMTLTSPGCPVAGTLPGEVKEKIKEIKQVNDVYIDLVWNPPWDKDMMSDEAKLVLGFY
ncbi:MAG TPA: SUF system Fe-S cluster assembly protein [Melioribacteraceae bacterium]|nr:SUF system Fe-S cluster assembly protein [Melioribacteraceae bacterium]